MVYLDFNATTPVHPAVREAMLPYLDEEFGNPSSRTHVYGQRAAKAVEAARDLVADVAEARPDEVTFTSGATEANNLAILGLEQHGRQCGKTHIVTTAIEHHAVLEPIRALTNRGFTATILAPTPMGLVTAESVLSAIRPDTLLVSIMHVNNETGTIQPIAKIADMLATSPIFLHTDAAQGYTKDLSPLTNKRVDMISISGHKIGGPKGIGALVCRRRDGRLAPLQPIMYGGGQERGLRPGTLATHQIVALGAASSLGVKCSVAFHQHCETIRSNLLTALSVIPYSINGHPNHSLPNAANIALDGVDAEALMIALREDFAISTGSACTSNSIEPSHVLIAMGLPLQTIRSSIRISWGISTPLDISFTALIDAARRLRT